MARGAKRMNTVMAAPVTLRTRAEVARFFEGLDLLEPGVVQAHRWRADPPDPDRDIPNYGGVARKQ
jgi:hypothetical protein